MQLLAGDVGGVGEEALACREDHRQVVAQSVLDRVVAEDEGPAEVGLVLLEDRPEVGEDDVVLADHPVRRVLPVRLESVGAGADDPLVPVPGGAEEFVGQVTDPVTDRPLPLPWCDQSALLDLREEPGRLGLGVQQSCRACEFVVRHAADRRSRVRSPATGMGWQSPPAHPVPERRSLAGGLSYCRLLSAVGEAARLSEDLLRVVGRRVDPDPVDVLLEGLGLLPGQRDPAVPALREDGAGGAEVQAGDVRVGDEGEQGPPRRSAATL